MRRVRAPFIASAAACLLAGCVLVSDAPDFGVPVAASTYGKMLARAERDDAESQNAVGYMLFQGEGVRVDEAQALLWFERAARQGNERARRNLSYLLAFPSATASRGAKSAFARGGEEARDPERLYTRFCGGCHGFNGIAAYENSPSFAFGERLEKPDATLLRSLLNGMQEMPGWEGKLPTQDLRAILAFVRTLPGRYDAGIVEPLRSAPEYVYLFGPMEARRGQAAR